MLQDTKINFQTAILAKEKGFDLTPFDGISAFNNKGEEVNWTTKQFFAWKPTQSLLQKWLREKHKIFVWVEICDANTINQFHKVYCVSKTKKEWKGNYSTYERALEGGLNMGLELIK